MSGRLTLTIVTLATLAGCAGDSTPSRTFAGGTYEQDLGLALVVDRVELSDGEAQAYVTIRNPTARKFTFDPWVSTLTVDGRKYDGHPSSDHPRIRTDVGAGGGESVGVLTFPAVPTDGTSYVLRLRGTSLSPAIGDDGLVTWDVTLSEPA